MKKSLYAQIAINKENERKEINLYKTKDEHYGIEIDTEEKGKLEVKEAKNIIANEEKVDHVLDIIVKSIGNIGFMEDIEYDYKDIKEDIG